MTNRRGFALITVLWIIAAASVVALGAALAARDSVNGVRNRVDAERAEWLARGCVARAVAAVDDALASASLRGTTLRVWRELDAAVDDIALDDATCAVSVEAAGSKVNVNGASRERIAAALRVLGAADPETLADSVLSHRPLGDAGALAFIAEFDSLPGLTAMFDTEPGRASLNTASLDVLRTLPGFTDELVQEIALDRNSGRQIADVAALGHGLAPAAADTLAAHLGELVQLTTVNPDAWVIRARATVGAPPLAAYADARVVLGQTRAIVARVRSWE